MLLITENMFNIYFSIYTYDAVKHLKMFSENVCASVIQVLEQPYAIME